MQICVVVLFVLTTNLVIIQGDVINKAAFDHCVKSCSNQFGECIKNANDLLADFMENKDKIVRIIARCCMRNAQREEASPTDSFAACTRIKCGARLYG